MLLQDADGPAALPSAFAFRGYVDFYGYHPPAAGWFFGGWLSHPWPDGSRPQDAVAEFDGGEIGGHALSMFFGREDVSGIGIGFVFFLRAAAPADGAFRRLRVALAGSVRALDLTDNALLLSGDDLAAHLRPLLSGGQAGSQRSRMAELVSAALPPAVPGFIEAYGYHAAAGGWLLCGWVGTAWPDGQAPQQVTAAFEGGDVRGEALVALYPRSELPEGGEGALAFVPGPAGPLGALFSVSFDFAGSSVTLCTTQEAPHLREAEIVARSRSLLAQASPGPTMDNFLGLLARRPYDGETTLDTLVTPVLMDIDEAILCGPSGLALMGWLLARPGDIKAIRVRSGPRVSPLALEGCLWLDRPDVLAAHGHSGDGARCGFLAFLPHAAIPQERLYIEVETARREVGYLTVQTSRLDGIAAMKRLLQVVDVRFAAVQDAYDRVVGPAMEALNRSRLAARPAAEVVEYGAVPRQPRFSVVVPLHGRLDFVEYQLALFSAHPRCAEAEFIYVLDDPPQRRAAQTLFASAHGRFRVPFRAVLLDANVGYAPASNIGLQHANGAFVAFLNSDVFPGDLDWLERLAARLDEDPALGAIGPLLLFEDGTVQHQGMVFEALPEFAGWLFPQHPGKGLRYAGPADDVQPCTCITGACMVLRREVALAAGGFDEAYVIGDFEDSDLCLKLQARGLGCAVDPAVRLFHLERKSQASSAAAWRMNLTTYNAWQHERRWGGTLRAHQGR